MSRSIRWQTYLAGPGLAVALLFAGCSDGSEGNPRLLEPESPPQFSMNTVTSVHLGHFDRWQSGNAAAECAQVGSFDYACGIDNWNGGMDGTYTCSIAGDEVGDNTMTISEDDVTYFDWSATNSIGAVIVRGGPAANVFYYDPQVNFDKSLFTPTDPSNNKRYDITHVTYCWNPDNGEIG